jgi:enterochelin esterase-like enzyme
MPRHNFSAIRGEVRRITVTSSALADNRLGDPSDREVAVYLPPGYDEGTPLPLMVGLAAFTGSGLKLLNWASFGESLPQRIERLITTGAMGPVVVALPDCFTSLGGNQYVDSPVLGRWEGFIRDDLLPTLAQRFAVIDAPRHRAVFGHSSGGYGALVQGLRHGEDWAAVAAHSADMGFDLLYRSDLPKAVDALTAHDGDADAFVAALHDAPKIRGDQFYALMSLAMAASYDPAEPDERSRLGLRLPVDLHTCELDESAWSRWLAHDPLMILEDPEARARLAALRCLHLDCGSRDEYRLHFGNRRFAAKLTAAGIDHHYEEFPDGHSKVAYRLDVSLPRLYEAIA